MAGPGVLGNDTDPSSEPLTTLLIGTDASNGSLTLNSDGSFTYTPTTGYYGPDSFTYQACNAELCSTTATSRLTVTQLAPVATGDSYNVQKNVTLSVAGPGVLGNDTDPNGLALHTVLGADVTNGTLTLNSDGSFDYTPDADYTGADSFTYQACTPAPVGLLVGGDGRPHDRQRNPGRSRQLLQRGPERHPLRGRPGCPGQRHRPQRRHPHGCGRHRRQQRHSHAQSRRLLRLHPQHRLHRC